MNLKNIKNIKKDKILIDNKYVFCYMNTQVIRKHFETTSG